jgi:ribose/xylose/arabinose/galactoside ABC-type transport system permease subunit
MSDGLRLPDYYYDATPDGPARISWGSVAVRAAFLLVAFAAGGVGGGYAWRHLWTPPTGKAVDGGWVPTPVEEGLQSDFSGVGWYVVVALVLGLVLGVLTAVVLDRAELVGVAVALAGSALAAYLVLTTGERLSPPDPDTVAATSQDGAEIPGDLEFDGWPPLLSCTIGTLAAVGGMYLVTPRFTRSRRNP